MRGVCHRCKGEGRGKTSLWTAGRVFWVVLVLTSVPVWALANPYRLFVSQIGYDCNMPQWALLRPSVDGDPNFPDSPNWVASTPNYVDEANSFAWVEVYQELGDGSYELVEANRSATIVKAPRTYQLNMYRVEWSSSDLPARGMVNICVHVQPSDANLPAMDANEAAPVGRDLLFQDTWKAIAIDEAKGREANEIEYGGGWAGNDGLSGEAVFMGSYTAGQAELLLKRSAGLSTNQQAWVLSQVLRGTNYLVSLHDISGDPNWNNPDPNEPNHICGPNQIYYCHPLRFLGENPHPNLWYQYLEDMLGMQGLLAGARALREYAGPNCADLIQKAIEAGASCYAWYTDPNQPGNPFGVVCANGVLQPNSPADPNLGHKYAWLASIAAAYHAAIAGDPNADPNELDEIAQHVKIFATRASTSLRDYFVDPNNPILRSLEPTHAYPQTDLCSAVGGVVYALENLKDPNIFLDPNVLDPNEPDAWLDLCTTLASVLQERYGQNAFGLTTPAQRVDDSNYEPSGSPMLLGGIAMRNWDMMGLAIAALRLRAVVSDPNFDLDGIATAHLQWYAGLNRGIPINLTRTLDNEGGDPNFDDPNKVASAFLYRITGRYTKCRPIGPECEVWCFPGANCPGVLIGGFTTEFGSNPSPWQFFISGEQCCGTDIYGSGRWLMAIANYGQPVTAGDVNRDGVTDLYDLSYAAHYVRGDPNVGDPNYYNRDVDLNEDGSVTIEDLNIIKGQFE